MTLFISHPAVRREPAVHGYDRARHEPARRVVREPEQTPHEVAYLPELLHGSGGEDLARARRRSAVRVEQQSPVLIGDEKSGRDGVAAYSAGREMHREPLGEIGYARFCCAVRRDLGQRRERVHGRDVDDVPARLHHVRRKHLRREERRDYVEVEHELQAALLEGEKVLDPLGVRGHVLVVGGGFGIVAARAVDEEIHRAERRVYLLFGALEVGLIKAVALHRKGVFTYLIRDLLRRLPVYVEERDLRPALRERTRELRTDHAARARHRDHFAA